MSQMIKADGISEQFPLLPEIVEADTAAAPEATATPQEQLTQADEQVEQAEEQLRDELAEGLMYLHSRANANTSKVLEVASFSYALIELLMERGLITVEELDERKKRVGQRLVEKFTEKGMGVALTDDERDKYSYEGGAQIDCENRLHLCRGACCRLSFALTVQDLEEGRVKWNFARPYMIRHDEDGYCHHIERETKRCGIYEGRPVICRAYDCRRDARIWADFDNRVVSPDLEKLFPNEENRHTEGRPPALYQLTRNRNDAHASSVMQTPAAN